MQYDLVGDALCHHGGSDLQEAGAVCTDHQVALGAGSHRSIIGSVEDALHDALQLGIHFLKAPAQALRVLAHLQTGGSHAACVGSLCGSVQDAVGQVDLDGLGSAGHISALADHGAAALHQSLCGLLIDLVLGSAGQGDVAGDSPDLGAVSNIGRILVGLGIFLDAATADFLQVLDVSQVDAVGVVDIAVGVGHGDDLGTQLGGLLTGVDSDIAGAGDDEDSQRLLRLFNTPEGQKYMKDELGMTDEEVEKMTWLGISGIANVLCCIKMAKYYELTENDVVATVLTDSAAMYGSRIEELNEMHGAYNAHEASLDHNLHMLGLKTDNMLELTYAERKRVHNLKYYTWVEQQGMTVEDLNAQWYDTKNTWDAVHAQAKDLDELINEFNEATGLLKAL